MIRQLDIFSSFHNTIKINGEELNKAERRAESLEAKVLDLLKKSPRGMTRGELCLVFGQQVPEVSVGRSLSNLVRKQEAVKTQEKRKGLWGIENFIYKAI